MLKCKHYRICKLIAPSNTETQEDEWLCILHSKNPRKNINKFKEAFEANRDQSEFMSDFSYVFFPEDYIFFSHGDPLRIFREQFLHFNNATFSGSPDFSLTFFEGQVNFSSAKFLRGADFSSSTFEQTVDFSNAQFYEEKGGDSNKENQEIDFRRATFHDIARFEGTKFYEKAEFSDSRFFESADFSESVFSSGGRFEQVTFAKRVAFWATQFDGGTISFRYALFLEGAFFASPMVSRPGVEKRVETRQELSRMTKESDEILIRSSYTMEKLDRHIVAIAKKLRCQKRSWLI
ncbi:MAG: hypothetical protein ETSY2_31140 [Candidatus Entotheonella gemina]|uniref:Pentapeptide repeat-containing protein n=1 Tax=Candidatus Entotheonella gemina TaxID=1429439 RepID=W4M247_9BACT|nr:MAG: hypothetical protein ETSY2_31140 [Candidatus Entotheonella gemina]